DERLDELRARHREERRVRLAGRRLGEQRLARARRADEQHALGRARADVVVLGRVLEVVADLAQLGDRLAAARGVVEAEARGALLLALARAARPLGEGREARRAAVLADAREEREQADEQQDRDQELDEDLVLRLAGLLVDGDRRAARVELAE